MEKIQSVVKDIVYRSDFFKKIYEGYNIEDFFSLPFIDKKDLLKDQIENSPFGSNLSVDKNSLKRIHRTSGTTARPLLLALTNNDINIVNKVGAEAFKVAGIEKSDIVFNCMNYSMWMGGLMDHHSLENSGACVVPYSVGKTENLINLLLEFDKPSIHCTPSYLSVIKNVLIEKYNLLPKDLGIYKGFFGGESGLQDINFRRKIEDEWGLIAINANYGMSDVISIMGSECKNRSGLHYVAGNYLYSELLDANNNILNLEEGNIGQLIVTTLFKEAQPLIRYKTGDIIEILSTEKCECGHESLRFQVIGRADDMLVIKGINFFPESLKNIISKYHEFSGNYYIEIEDKLMVDSFKLIIEKADSLITEFNTESLLIEIKESLFVSPSIHVVDKIDIYDNKQKMIRRINY